MKSESAQLATVRDFVDSVGVELSLDMERIFDLKVAVSEACANAVEHAGRDGAFLEVEAGLEHRRLTFTVADSGPFRAPILPRQPNQSRGLGLPLMVTLMDEVCFFRMPGGGTAVKLTVLI
ncbi:MAG: ATP-binding protein [Actinobacteria bacterium]|nr:ATP-binding protein [Actinomycetota bacterium]